MALTDVEIRAAKPGDRTRQAVGRRRPAIVDHARWREALATGLSVRGGQQKTLAIGVYPATGLREARDARDRGQAALGRWTRPVLAKKLAKAAKADRSRQHLRRHRLPSYWTRSGARAKADQTLRKLEWLLSLARPAIGARPICEITAPEILAVLRSVESRGRHETARRLRATIGEVFRYAVATGRAEADPTGALKGALTAPTVQHRAAIIEPKAFGGASPRHRRL